MSHSPESPKTPKLSHRRAASAKGHPQASVAADEQAEKHHKQSLTLECEACAITPQACKDLQQSQPGSWFHSLPPQRFQALLTLFPKSFSSFPHGTCLLSVSSLYFALDEIYHLIYAPIPRSVTLGARTVRSGRQATRRILTRVNALFQEAYACAAVGTVSAGHNPRPKPQFPTQAFPCSFAITEGILFSSFSSAYLYA